MDLPSGPRMQTTARSQMGMSIGRMVQLYLDTAPGRELTRERERERKRERELHCDASTCFSFCGRSHVLQMMWGWWQTNFWEGARGGGVAFANHFCGYVQLQVEGYTDKMNTFYVSCHKPGYKHHGRHFWRNDQGTEDGMKGKIRLERSQHNIMFLCILLCIHPLKGMKKVSEMMFPRFCYISFTASVWVPVPLLNPCSEKSMRFC